MLFRASSYAPAARGTETRSGHDELISARLAEEVAAAHRQHSKSLNAQLLTQVKGTGGGKVRVHSDGHVPTDDWDPLVSLLESGMQALTRKFE